MELNSHNLEGTWTIRIRHLVRKCIMRVHVKKASLGSLKSAIRLSTGLILLPFMKSCTKSIPLWESDLVESSGMMLFRI